MAEVSKTKERMKPGEYRIMAPGELDSMRDLRMWSDQKAANPSGIIPVEYKVVVLPRKVEEKTKGGIIRPDIVVEKDEHAAVEGIIVALSPLAFTYEEWPAGARKPQAGDSVLFARYSGIRHKGKDGETYVIMNDKDIAAIMEGANV